ncbi:hypothetical protein ACHAXR_004099 [Thalassiosira sp. AJA248-18]
MEIDKARADQLEPPPSASCRVAIIGAQRQRVAKVTALIHADKSLGYVSTTSLLSFQSTVGEVPQNNTLPEGVPTAVEVEYLPCVATFDSYEDEHGESVRYLVKLEHHGANGTLVKGKSLAPFFDEAISATEDDDDENAENPFPAGIAAVAIGCGIDTKEDVDKIQNFLKTLASSCVVQISSKQSNDGSSDMLVECIEPNPEYSSMKAENEAFRDLDDEGKREAVSNGTIGPGKMANFVYKVARGAIRQRWDKELTKYEQSLSERSASTDDTTEVQPELHPPVLESPTKQDDIQSTPTHTPNPENNRYACKRCRTILFGVDDLEDPPHAQSQHNFRKRGPNNPVYGADGTCQNHFISQPLSWMNGCAEMEGKLHCPKCNTKVGHYSWTGAQCSCGTWVTPAIMVPVSKVDEMKPISQNIIAATGALFVNHHVLKRASSTQPSAATGVNPSLGLIDQRIGSMTIAAESASPLNFGPSA